MSKVKNKTTKHHFALFKRTVQETVELLGLKEYEINTHHVPLGHKADIQVHDGVLAVIQLSENWQESEVTDEAVIASAKHEVLHLLLHRLLLVSYDRFSTMKEMDRAEHDIVYRLEKVL